MTLVLARPETSGPRMRLYCEMLPSLLVGVPSKNHNGRPRMPVLPPSTLRFDEVTRSLNAGSRYLSNRSIGSMMCMSQSTKRYPSFISGSLPFGRAQRATGRKPVVVVAGLRILDEIRAVDTTNIPVVGAIQAARLCRV